jgi:DNA-binding response OmpR family regulator
MPKKICIVDDEPDIVEILATVLRTKDYEIHTAANGVIGMELIQQVDPDLAILDLMMPGLSGLEMCKRLRSSEKYRTLPIIVLSAIGKDSGKSEEFWAAGLKSDEFMHKPFEPLDLLGRVEYLLRRRSYIKPNAARAPGSEDADAKEAASLSPEDVVKVFIESWNAQNFNREFNCLGEEMQFGLTSEQYVSRRFAAYQHGDGASLTQHYLETVSTQIDHKAATVVCLRENRKGKFIDKKQESYILRQAPQGWKIIKVSTRSA